MPKINKDKLTFRNLGMEDTNPDITKEPFVQKIIPNITLTEEQLPELKGKNELGTECHLYVIARMTDIREPEDWDMSKNPVRGFELVQAAYIGTKEPGKEIKYVEGYEDATY